MTRVVRGDNRPSDHVRAQPAALADPAELPQLDQRQLPWPGEQVTSGGVTLHVRRTPGPPDAAPAVYLHGLSGSATNWTDLAGQLAGRAAGLAVDLPGFGLSRPLRSREYSPSAHADAVMCFLAGRNEPVHLLGNSLGGTIAMIVAARRPELVRSLTLISPAMPDRRPDPRRLSDPRIALAAIPWMRPRVAAALAAVTPREQIAQVLRLCFADPSAVPEHRIQEAIDEAADRAAQPWAIEAAWQAGRGMVVGWFGVASLWSVARRVQAPTLVVWGGQDRLVSPKLAARTVASLPRGRLLMLADAGHLAQVERPVTVARAVLGLWDTAAPQWPE